MRTDSGDSDARVSMALDLDRNVLVAAGAGTGKTTALVGRVMALIDAGESLRQMAVITFTEAAAAELRQQIRHALDTAAGGTGDQNRDESLAAVGHEVDDATICTVHSLAHRILIDHCVEAGLSPRFDVLDDTADAADFDVRWNRFADTLLEDPEAERALVLGFSVGLRPTDLASVAWALHSHWDRLEDGGLEHLTAAPRCSASWPSTDPTPVIDALDRARRAADWCRQADDRMALHLLGPVTDAGARLAAAGPDSLAVFQLLSTLPPFRCAQGRQENWDGHIAEVRAACAEAEQIRRDFLDHIRQAVLGDLVARLAVFTLASAEERRIEGKLTFHDLLVHARRLGRGRGPALDVLRRRYRRLLIDEFQDTDPLQMELATLLASADGTTGLDGSRPGALFLVGDPQQSIYRFRRADPALFDRVGDEIGATLELQTNYRSVPGIIDFVNVVFDTIFGDGTLPGQVTHHPLVAARPVPAATTGGGGLPRPEEVAAVQLSFAGFEDSEIPASLAHRRAPGGAGARAPAPVVTVGGALAASHSEIRRRAAGDAALAVTEVVGQGWLVEDTGGGNSRPARFGDIAVLIPARSTLAALEHAFEEAGVPYRLEGAALLWGAAEVRDVVAVLRTADDPADSVSVLAALRSPGLACGDDDLVSWHAAGGTWDPRPPAPPGLDAHPVSVAMAVLDRLHRRRWWTEPSAMVGAAYGELFSFELALAHRRPRDHWQRLRWLQDQARLFDESRGGTLREFLDWAELRATADGRSAGVGPPDPDDDAVRVMTIHGAKGLEFPVVVLAGLERERSDGPRSPTVVWTEHGTPEISAGLFRTAGYEQAGLRAQHLDVLEQHRLLYVAMTRARDHLVLCLHHRERNGAPDASLAALVTRICTAHPARWRRLSVTAPTGTTTAPVRPDGDGAPAPAEALPATWEADRARLLSALRRQPVTTATALAPGPSTGQDIAGDPLAGRRAEERRRVGRAVHQALATLDVSTGAVGSGPTLGDVARAAAAAEGVTSCASEVTAMVERALSSPTLTGAAGRRTWRRVDVNTTLGSGRLLEGSVELLLEEDDGLVVIEYETESVEGGPDPATLSAARRLQLAAYAEALESSTELPVARCVLVIIGAGGPLEHVLVGDDLRRARAEVRQAAETLVGT